jgi:molybdate transport system substrate-binding protein
MDITRRAKLVGLVVAALLLAAASGASAAETQVAVAANFTEPAKEIAAAFKTATGHTAVLTFGSSGAFMTQISKGAPFEVFLSADAERPTKAEQDGLAVPKTRFTYALGRLVLYSKQRGLVDGQAKVLTSGKFQKLAIADPAAAPYGVAAIETLKKLGRYDALQPKIVQGSSIAQTYQFIDSGAAELGFVALSQVINVQGGSRWAAPKTLHTPITQDAVLLYTGDKNPAARAFMTFLKSRQAVAIINRYGYEVP